MSDTALKHIEHLAVTIGPRGSTTPKEKEAHDYIQNVLNDLGCAPRLETYLSRTSTYTPFILGLGTVLLAEALFWSIGSPTEALAALCLGILAVAGLAFELLGMDNPLRWFVPSAPSQNVIGVTPARGEAQRRVVVMAHVDTHRTPLFWRTPAAFAAYRVITALGLLSLVVLCVMFGLAIFTPGAALRTYSLAPAGVVALAFLMVVQAHFTPFTAGANDNASGVGVMLALADKLHKKPLKSTDVWWVATGCEEVGPYGSLDFVRRHQAEFKDGALIVVDNIAGKDTGPVYLDGEGIVVPVRYSPEMLGLADQISAEHPEWGGRRHTQQGAYTDGYYALKAGLKCLTFVGYRRDGWIPNWHNPSDVFASVDAGAVDRTERFVWEVLRKLDAG